MKVSRAADALEREKLIRKHRGAWQLAGAGEKALTRLDLAGHAHSNYPLDSSCNGVCYSAADFATCQAIASACYSAYVTSCYNVQKVPMESL
jgi:hypothetical protein